MQRYLIEVAYIGANYAGFQKQENAHTIQSQVEKALETLYRTPFLLTGSSRTDAGVHAEQNFFHFDSEKEIMDSCYNLNAILPSDICIRTISKVTLDFHCRFSALRRYYIYTVYQSKNPFLHNTAFYYPWPLDINLLNKAATFIKASSNFIAFSKKNTQVSNFQCAINYANWIKVDNYNGCLQFHIEGNRFLRGMVRGLVATMLRVGSNKLSLSEFENIINSKSISSAFFDVPAKGLLLKKVTYSSKK
jgi:tRNA pseudouridine38-40 synthase